MSGGVVLEPPPRPRPVGGRSGRPTRDNVSDLVVRLTAATDATPGNATPGDRGPASSRCATAPAATVAQGRFLDLVGRDVPTWISPVLLLLLVSTVAFAVLEYRDLRRASAGEFLVARSGPAGHRLRRARDAVPGQLGPFREVAQA